MVVHVILSLIAIGLVFLTSRVWYLYGYTKATDKACEWLKENKDHPFIGCEDPCLSGYLTDKFIEEFKKAMEV